MLGEKGRDNYIFIITCINFRSITCTPRKTWIWAHEFKFQWSSCYRTTETFCISISSGNPIPRNKFKNWAMCQAEVFQTTFHASGSPCSDYQPLVPPPYPAWGAAGVGVPRPHKAAEVWAVNSGLPPLQTAQFKFANTNWTCCVQS